MIRDGTRRCTIFFLCILWLVFLCLTSGYAQSQSQSQSQFEDDTSGEQEKRRNFRVTPFVAPGYTPELGFMLVGGGLFTFSTDPANAELKRSNFSVSAGYTTNNAIIFSSLWKTYWLDDKIRVNMDVWFKDMPDNYWGVGYDNARNTPKGDLTTAYDRTWWQVNPFILWQFIPNLFAGLNFDFNQTIATNPSPGVASDPDVLYFGTNNYNGGAGFIFAHDSRDMPENARSGWLLASLVTFYGKFLGSDNTYQVFEIDYRQFQEIVRPGSTLAWQVYARIGTGNVPWPETTQIGTPFDLRGYYWGWYRDRVGTFAIVEYRYMFMQSRPNRLRSFEGRKESRFGFVTWVGLGLIGHDVWDLVGHYMPNVGVGLRYEVQPRMNARADFGIGLSSTGIYFNFTEAF